jgi:hypothetical protein
MDEAFDMKPKVDALCECKMKLRTLNSLRANKLSYNIQGKLDQWDKTTPEEKCL